MINTIYSKPNRSYPTTKGFNKYFIITLSQQKFSNNQGLQLYYVIYFLNLQIDYVNRNEIYYRTTYECAMLIREFS